MKKLSASLVFAFLFTALVLLFSTLTQSAPIVNAQRGVPPNDHKRGLVYDGLELGSNSQCRGAFHIKTSASSHTRAQCTHGPDYAPFGFDVQAKPSPVSTSSTATSSTVSCDGDGTTGNRIQVIYAHAADVPDQYATYLTLFQQWAADADSDFNASAAQTGGSRRVRYVTDTNCNPTVLDVALSVSGDDNFANTIADLESQGYNRMDRKYMVFVDAHVYCGISNWQVDDTSGPGNQSNSGDQFSRIDAGCWSGVIAAHELMHNLGGVQLSAPHSDGNAHCNDGYDNMCDHSGHIVATICTNTAMDSLFDCNHDDYFSTNPPPNSYLATHWNSANSIFLIVPAYADVNVNVTGKLKAKTFTTSDSFNRGDTVTVQVHVVDQNGASLSKANVSLSVRRPDGSAQCTLSVTTGTTGYAQASCLVPSNATTGGWDAHVDNVTKSGKIFNSALSVTDHNFTVQ